MFLGGVLSILLLYGAILFVIFRGFWQLLADRQKRKNNELFMTYYKYALPEDDIIMPNMFGKFKSGYEHRYARIDDDILYMVYDELGYGNVPHNTELHDNIVKYIRGHSHDIIAVLRGNIWFNNDDTQGGDYGGFYENSADWKNDFDKRFARWMLTNVRAYIKPDAVMYDIVEIWNHDPIDYEVAKFKDRSVYQNYVHRYVWEFHHDLFTRSSVNGLYRIVIDSEIKPIKEGTLEVWQERNIKYLNEERNRSKQRFGNKANTISIDDIDYLNKQ